MTTDDPISKPPTWWPEGAKASMNPPERSEVTEQRYPTMAQTARNAHKLIDALATGRITGELAHAYLSADLQEDQLDAILKAHTAKPPAQQPAPFSPGQILPPRPSWPPAPYPGIPNAIPTKKDPLSPPWEVTCSTYPGQPLSTTTMQRLYPTTAHPAPFRPHKQWSSQGYGYSGPNTTTTADP